MPQNGFKQELHFWFIPRVAVFYFSSLILHLNDANNLDTTSTVVNLGLKKKV